MSGRVRWFRRGKLVVGYRKTDRTVEHRRRPHEMPPLRLRFVLPEMTALGIEDGPVPGMIGASIRRIGHTVVAEIIGRDRAWMLMQANDLADRLGHWRRPLSALITRDPEPGPTLSGPLQRGDDAVVEIGRGTVTEGNAMRSTR